MAGIYIHIPFCKQACFYCDFHFSTSLKKKDTLIQSLVKELELRQNELQNQIVESIYFGGGTPSLLSIDELQLLIGSIYKYYKVSENPEITLEANPDDLSENKMIQLSKSPINRLSIGIQSFFEDDLKSMNRAHNAEEAINCLSFATRFFDNITIDLIYGIPNMSLEKWQENLEKAFSFGVNHVSSYALTVEPKTALDTFIKKGNYPPIDENLALQHFNHLIEKTKGQGFVHYEISNFGKPNFFSKHNTSYWQGKPYLGIGPSAHSFFENQRSWNVSNNSKYIQSIQKSKLPNTIEILSKQDQYNEYIMTGLRTIWGVSLNKVEHDFGADILQHLKTSSEKFINQSLLVIVYETEKPVQDEIFTSEQVPFNDVVLKITQKGKFLVDGIASELFMI
ncbi:coproporphyrinogen III oxidase [Pseudalgibacter alginicilyticus]|uniref:Heme chaperone HemW n=1 Tax=Pseudalgibacter alginicilyticus TaxID=1736674 RepID=A0A0P0DAN9_9FLAO|nr:radical SAM family heme chaperone HemW [Pseudalgibacter alginicilyticus]ALJ05955.1 coproporphyrinogen III oxidase [Pseudalgibacter alginicilyticus]